MQASPLSIPRGSNAVRDARRTNCSQWQGDNESTTTEIKMNGPSCSSQKKSTSTTGVHYKRTEALNINRNKKKLRRALLASVRPLCRVLGLGLWVGAVPGRRAASGRRSEGVHHLPRHREGPGVHLILVPLDDALDRKSTRRTPVTL